VAEVHRWAFLTAPEAGLGGAGGLLCVETRVVAAVEFHKSYHTKEVGVSGVSQCAFKPPAILPWKGSTGRRRHERIVAPLHLQALSHPQPSKPRCAQPKMMGELVRQPGARAIIHAGKDVEDRGWWPGNSNSRYRSRAAIHGGPQGHQMNEDEPDTVSRTSPRNASSRALMPRAWI
jgi:hypothetical protein